MRKAREGMTRVTSPRTMPWPPGTAERHLPPDDGSTVPDAARPCPARPRLAPLPTPAAPPAPTAATKHGPPGTARLGRRDPPSSAPRRSHPAPIPGGPPRTRSLDRLRAADQRPPADWLVSTSMASPASTCKRPRTPWRRAHRLVSRRLVDRHCNWTGRDWLVPRGHRVGSGILVWTSALSEHRRLACFVSARPLFFFLILRRLLW